LQSGGSNDENKAIPLLRAATETKEEEEVKQKEPNATKQQKKEGDNTFEAVGEQQSIKEETVNPDPPAEVNLPKDSNMKSETTTTMTPTSTPGGGGGTPGNGGGDGGGSPQGSVGQVESASSAHSVRMNGLSNSASISSFGVSDNGINSDEEWSDTTGPHSTLALLYPLLWPPPKHCRSLPGGHCELGRDAVAWLPEGAAVEVAGVRSAAWIKLSSTLAERGVTLTATRGGVKSVSRGNSVNETLGPNHNKALSAKQNPAQSGTTSTTTATTAATTTATGRRNKGIALVLNSSVLPHPSSFRLTICSQGVALIAADPQGLLFGTFCLCQLIDFYGSESAEGGGGLVLPAVCIEDYPDFTRRGVIIDARFPHTPRRHRLKAIVEQIASWRINTVHLVLDEQPPPATTKRASNKKAANLKKGMDESKGLDTEPDTTDLLEFDALCQHYFITLIPSWVPKPDMFTCPLDRFRELSCRQLSLIFSQSNEPNHDITEEQVSSLLESVLEQGHFDTVHLWGLPPNTLAAIANDPLRHIPPPSFHSSFHLLFSLLFSCVSTPLL